MTAPRATTMGVSGYVVVEKTQASPPASERDADPPVRRVIVNICEPCIRAEGQECHTPGCLLFLHRVDIPFMEELMEPAPESAGLFRSGPVTLHSGAVSDFKIDCDALTNEDWRALATMVAAGAGAVGKVSGIPRGGLKLADALTGVVTWVATGPVLIVDDVLTTGTSMEQARRAQIEAGETREIKGAVVFARIPSAPWISALFTMSPEPAAFRAGRG